jgi:putative ABC transport system substrate-binding protein
MPFLSLGAGMKRRDFLGAVGCAVMWPLPAWAQQTPVIGILNSASAGSRHERFVAFRQGLSEAGYVEGQNVTIEYRFADDQYDRLPSLAEELVRRSVAVLVATGGPVAALAAKSATATTPIVFTAVADPIKSGLVTSLNRPGGNLTGTAGLTSELDPKRLELLHELLPTAGIVGVLANPNRPNVDAQLKDVQAASGRIGRQLAILMAGTDREIDTAFESLAQRQIGALLVMVDPYFASRRAQIISLAARYAVASVYQWREDVLAGGLLSYGANPIEMYRQAGVYTGRILKGEKPGDLPVMQPTKFELIINLKTAKALGLDVPAMLLARADEVIE